MADKLQIFLKSNTINFIIGCLIIANLITLGMETSPYLMEHFGSWILGFNHFILFMFCIEIAIRILIQRLKFFYSGWNLLDFSVVLLTIITLGGVVQVFRVLRVVWLLRLLTFMPHFKHLVDSVSVAIPKLLGILTLMFLTVYVFAIIGVMQYGHSHPEIFIDIKTAMGSLLQAAVMPKLWLDYYNALGNDSWQYLIPILIITNFLFLQLILGVLIMSLHQQKTAPEEISQEAKMILEEIQYIKKKLGIEEIPPSS